MSPESPQAERHPVMPMPNELTAPAVQALLALSRDAVLIVRWSDHQILASNVAAQRLYGVSCEGLLTQRLDDVVVDQAALSEVFAQRREHVPLRYHRRPDGSRFPAELSVHWCDDDAAQTLWGCFRVRDLSREEAEARRLKAAEERFGAVFGSAPFAILLLDRRGSVTAANAAALTVYRAPHGTLVGESVGRLVRDTHDIRQYFRSPHWSASGQWHRRCDGELFLADVSLSVVRVSAQVHAVLVVRDITQERALLERLQASEARWRFALEGHGDALWEWDVAQGLFQVSQALSVDLGRPQETSSAVAYWQSLVHPQDLGRLRQAMVAHLKGQTELIDIEIRLRWRDGADRWVWLRGRVLERDTTGRALRMLGSVRDVQAQKQQAEELAHWREQVQHQARVTSMGEMAAALAHELNQPLTSIRSFSAAALRRLDREDLRDPVELRRAVQLIADEAMRAGRIMQHIHSFVRKGAMRAEQANLNEVILHFQQLADIWVRRTGVSLVLTLEEALPPVLVDRVLAEQVLHNLVRNALDAMQGSHGARQIDIVSARQGPGHVCVSVRDHGTGLPAHVSADLYAPFVSTKAQGLGMGLAICRSIVESHGGVLWAQTHPEGGAVFHFTLPTVSASPLAQAQSPSPEFADGLVSSSTTVSRPAVTPTPDSPATGRARRNAAAPRVRRR